MKDWLGIIILTLVAAAAAVLAWVVDGFKPLAVFIAAVFIADLTIFIIFSRPGSNAPGRFFLLGMLISVTGYTVWRFLLPVAGVAVAVVGVLGILIWRSTREYDEHVYSRKLAKTPVPKEIQLLVKSRAKNKCQWVNCRKIRHLRIYHIDGDLSNHHLTNLIYLCHNHCIDAQSKEVRYWQLRDWSQGNYSH